MATSNPDSARSFCAHRDASFNPRQILNARTTDPLSLNLNVNGNNQQPFNNFGLSPSTTLDATSSGNGLNDNIAGSISSSNNAPATNNNAGRGRGGTRLVLQLPVELGNPRRNISSDTTRRVNTALTEILQGVRSASLERILRGSLSFSRNQNLRSVGDTVLNNLFVRATQRRAQTNNGATGITAN
jgi:hypothetical protein